MTNNEVIAKGGGSPQARYQGDLLEAYFNRNNEEKDNDDRDTED